MSLSTTKVGVHIYKIGHSTISGPNSAKHYYYLCYLESSVVCDGSMLCNQYESITQCCVCVMQSV